MTDSRKGHSPPSPLVLFAWGSFLPFLSDDLSHPNSRYHPLTHSNKPPADTTRDEGTTTRATLFSQKSSVQTPDHRFPPPSSLPPLICVPPHLFLLRSLFCLQPPARPVHALFLPTRLSPFVLLSSSHLIVPTPSHPRLAPTQKGRETDPPAAPRRPLFWAATSPVSFSAHTLLRAASATSPFPPRLSHAWAGSGGDSAKPAPCAFCFSHALAFTSLLARVSSSPPSLLLQRLAP